MQTPIHGISLRLVRHDDRSDILSAWTVEHGRLAVTMPAGQSPRARRLRPMAMPLSMWEGQAELRPGRDIVRVSDMRPWILTPDIAARPSKALVALFVAEALEHITRTASADAALSATIAEGIAALDAWSGERALGLLPPLLLYRLTRPLGIEPDAEQYRPGCVFHMASGRYAATPPTHGRWLDRQQTAHLRMLARMTYDTAPRMHPTRPLRQCMLDTVLEYYALHGHDLGLLGSLEILRGF